MNNGIPIIGEKKDRPFDYCLVTPYQDPNPKIRAARARAACQMTADMIAAAEGSTFILCPVVYVHSMLVMGPTLHLAGPLWEYYEEIMFDLCDALLVLEQPGWKIAPEVQVPISRAKELNKEVTQIQPLGKFYVELDNIIPFNGDS